MKLDKGDKIKYDDSVYSVVAIIWNTLYLQKVEDGSNAYLYTMDQVYEKYKDIEFLKEDSLNE